jgi:hypothetical protein
MPQPQLRVKLPVSYLSVSLREIESTGYLSNVLTQFNANSDQSHIIIHDNVATAVTVPYLQDSQKLGANIGNLFLFLYVDHVGIFPVYM